MNFDCPYAIAQLGEIEQGLGAVSKCTRLRHLLLSVWTCGAYSDGLPVPCLDKSTDVVCLLVFRSIPFSSLSATVLDFNSVLGERTCVP